MRTVLLILLGLMIWGPPRLRFTPRPLETALEQPLDLDFAALFQVAVWIVSGLVVAYLIAERGILQRKLIPSIVLRSSLRLYLIYGTLALASTIYSESPVYTAFFASKIFISIAAVALVTGQADLHSQYPLLLRLFFGVSLLEWAANAALLAYDPDLVGTTLPNIGYRLAGGFFGDYGTPAAMSGLYFLLRAVFHSNGPARSVWCLLYSVSWVFLAFSRTRSSIVGAVAMLFIAFALHRRSSSRLLAVSAAGMATLGIAAFGAIDSLVSFGLRGQTLEILMTLTGRSTAFDFLLRNWSEAPWLGFGYAAGSRALLMHFVRDTGLGFGSAHDALSKVLVELGIVGLALLVVIVILTTLEVLRVVRSARKDEKLRPLATALLAVFVYFTLTSVVAGGVAEVPYPFLIVSAGCALIRDRLALGYYRQQLRKPRASLSFQTA